MVKMIPANKLRLKLGNVLHAVRAGQQIVYLTRRGCPVAVLMSYEHHEALASALEDLSDLLSLRAVADEPVRLYDEFMVEL